MIDNLKYDDGKAQLHLVPTKMIEAIARVREYGVSKYKTEDGWKLVEPERYRDALFRHLLLYMNEPYGIDDESKLPHLWHIACNVAFLTELEWNKDEYVYSVAKLNPTASEMLEEMEK